MNKQSLPPNREKRMSKKDEKIIIELKPILKEKIYVAVMNKWYGRIEELKQEIEAECEEEALKAAEYLLLEIKALKLK